MQALIAAGATVDAKNDAGWHDRTSKAVEHRRLAASMRATVSCDTALSISK